MALRRTQLSEFAPEITWLGNADSKLVFGRAAGLLGKFQFRLDAGQFNTIERRPSGTDESETREWLAVRVGFGDAPLLVVFSEDTVCALRTSFFLDHWQDLFSSGRADGIVIPPTATWALVYWQHHFEFGAKPLAVES